LRFSSTTPANFPLPRTAARLGFVLLALRARRNRHSRHEPTLRQEGFRKDSSANCGTSWTAPLAVAGGGSPPEPPPTVAASPETIREIPEDKTSEVYVHRANSANDIASRFGTVI
jgi:hypothetical protein